jgi:phage portal protein BeeE
MKLFGFNINVTRRSSSPAGPPAEGRLSEAAYAWLGAEDHRPAVPALSNAYQQVVWVYRAITVLAEQVANIPFLFSRGERGREHLITSGPLLDFYGRPHPHINSFQYWELRVLWLMLRGECMRIPIYDDGGTAVSAFAGENAMGEEETILHGGYSSEGIRGFPPLRPSAGDRVLQPPPVAYSSASSIPRARPAASVPLAAPTPRKLKHVLILDPCLFEHVVQGRQLVGWRYKGLGAEAPLESQVFLPEEVWFEKLPNPFNFWRGMPPLFVADLAAKTDYAAAAFMKGFLENNADNGLIVRTSEQLDDTQRAQIMAALRRRKSRAGAADQPLLLWSSAEVIRPELSSADLQYLENRKFSRAEICAAFGVPEEIVGSTDSAKYDVMQGARLNFIEHRVAPLCARLEAEEQATIKSIEPKAMGWFDLDSLPSMQAARRARLATAKTGFDMGIPFNELNRVLDLGFKPLPWGDAGYLPSNLKRTEG